MSIDFHKLKEKRREHRASGGKVHEDKVQDEKLIKKMVGKAKIKLHKGGDVEGEKEHKRGDKRERYARGGHTKGKEKGTKVNVIVAGGGSPNTPPMGAPMGAPRPPMAPPPGAGAPPPGAGAPPMGGAPGMKPPGAKHGGRMTRKEGGRIGEQEREHDKERSEVPKAKGEGKREERDHDEKHHRYAKKRGGCCD